MTYSRAEIEAELKRRGVPIPGQQQMQGPRQLSRAEIEAELKRRGVPIPGQQQMNPFMSAAVGFNKGIEDVTHGLLQPIFESGYLGEGLKRGSQEVAKERQQLYKEAHRQNPLSALGGNFAGGTAISLPASAATGGSALLSKAPGFLKYLAPMLGGAVGGAATGAAQYVNPEESRAENALRGGAFGAALGGLAGAGKGIANVGSAVKRAYPAEKVAQRVLSDRAQVSKTYGDAYKDLFKQAEEQGIHNLKAPKINSRAIKENTTSKEYQAIEKFIENPTLEHGHKAQSDLGRTIRRLQKIHEGVGLNTSQQQALESALKAQKKIRGSMFDGLSKGGNQDLASKYGELTRGYAKDVLPYTKSKPINAYRKGELTEKDFLQALGKNKAFKKQLGEKYPELDTRTLMGLIGKKSVGAGMTGGAIEALHLLGLI